MNNSIDTIDLIVGFAYGTWRLSIIVNGGPKRLLALFMSEDAAELYKMALARMMGPGARITIQEREVEGG